MHQRWRARWPFGGQSHIDNVLQNNECHNKAGGLDSEDKTIIKRRKSECRAMMTVMTMLPSEVWGDDGDNNHQREDLE